MSIANSLLVRFDNPSLIDFKLYITACKTWLGGNYHERNFTESKGGVSYCYVPDESITSGSTGDVLRFLFGEDVEFPNFGEAVPYLLTRLCAQALDSAKINIRYIPQKCSTVNDKHGISISLSQDDMNTECYHNTLLIIERDGTWHMTIDGCWGGRDDGVGPTYYPEEYKYQGQIRGMRNSITSFTSTGDSPFRAFTLWNVNVVRLQTMQPA